MTLERDLGAPETQQGHYAGPVTRLAAFALDQATVTALFAVGSAVLTWSLSLVTDARIDVTEFPVLSGVVYTLWWIVYFAYPWGTSGKSFGMAVLGIRVVSRDGSPCSGGQAILRVLGLVLSFLTLGLGFVGIVVGREHRGLQDVVAGTAVVYAWDARGARLRFLAREQAAREKAARENVAREQARARSGA